MLRSQIKRGWRKAPRFHAATNEATARINAQRWQSGVEPPHSKKSSALDVRAEAATS
jgi:hypothetical protein